MKRSKITLMLSIWLFSSCAVFQPNISNQNVNNTQVVLSKNNFSVVSTAHASATASYFFGFGGVLRTGLVNDARSRLYDAVELKGSQVLINEHVEFKSSAIIPGIWYSTTAVVSGVIIEFTDEN